MCNPEVLCVNTYDNGAKLHALEGGDCNVIKISNTGDYMRKMITKLYHYIFTVPVGFIIQNEKFENSLVMSYY
jgi:hypothetical protein